MPSRPSRKSLGTKQSNFSWTQCSICELYIHNQELKLHESFCSKNKGSPLPHGYIKDGVFHGKICYIDKKKRAKLQFPTLITQLVLMHPSTMKTFHYGQGQYIILKTDCDEQVFRCWSCIGVSPSSILLTHKWQKLLCKTSEAAVYSYDKYAEPANVADELCLLPSKYKDFMASKTFTDFLLKEFAPCFARVGMMLQVSYLGVRCELRVASISGGDIDSKSDVEALTEQYSHLQIRNKPMDYSGDDTSCNESKNISVITEELVPKMCSTPLSTKKSDGQSSRLCTSSQNESFFTRQEVVKTSEVYYAIERLTRIKIIKDKLKALMKDPISFNQIGGLGKQIESLRTLLSDFLPHNSQSHVDSSPSGILLSGPPGTGKSLLARIISSECQVPHIMVNGREFGRFSTKAFSNLRKRFQEAITRAPCLLVLDDVDYFYQKKDDQQSYENKLIVEELPSLFDDLPKYRKSKVVVVAITNKLECLDQSLRCKGRLEKEIRFCIPTSDERKEILESILRLKGHSLTESEVAEISYLAHGYTGNDLKSLCNKASIKADLQNHVMPSGCMGGCLSYDILHQCLEETNPVSMGRFVAKAPKVQWEDIGGMHQIKQELLDMVDLPLKKPEAFLEFGITPTRGVLMFGPPGCSKTMIAKALATECKLNFIAIKGPELLNQWVGQSEKAVTELFKRARASAPCIIFFDEIDSLAASRSSSQSGSNVGSRVLSQLLTEIDGVDVLKGVSLLATTNRPDLIDAALLRPGRFDRVLYVPLPDSKTRKEILEITLKNMSISDDINYEKLVELTNGYSGAEIIAICQEAATMVIYKDPTSETSVVQMEYLLESLKAFPPRTSIKQIEFYETYKSEFQYH